MKNHVCSPLLDSIILRPFSFPPIRDALRYLEYYSVCCLYYGTTRPR